MLGIVPQLWELSRGCFWLCLSSVCQILVAPFVQWKVKAFNNQQCKCTSVLKNCHLKKFILSIGSKCIYMCFGFSVSRCNSQKKTFVTESFGVKCIFACQNTRDAWDDLIAPSIEFLRQSPAMSRSIMTLAHI